MSQFKNKGGRIKFLKLRTNQVKLKGRSDQVKKGKNDSYLRKGEWIKFSKGRIDKDFLKKGRTSQV